MTSEQYWVRRLAQLSQQYPGKQIVKVDAMPPPSKRQPNTVYIRPSKGGKWARSVLIRVT